MNNPTVNDLGTTSKLTTVLHVIYGLHAVGLAIGAFGAASVVGSFLFGWPSIIAIIISYVYKGEARGTWLESHFSWAIRTFWWAVVIAILVALGSLVLLPLLGLGIVTWMVGMPILGLWAIYRIARGWLNLKARQPMPM